MEDMAITGEQFKKWAQAPDPEEMKRIQRTREKIEEVIRKNLPEEEIKRLESLRALDYKIYLQGSYKNNTNISFESDVDIVLQLNTIFSNDTSLLREEEKQKHSLEIRDVNYTFTQWKQHTYQSLYKGFGGKVTLHKKCIQVDDIGFGIKADVVPCFEHRVYQRFHSFVDGKFDYIPGISFYNTDTNEKIISFPIPHINNCTVKHQATGEMFKKMVRIFKNLKVELVNKGMIDDNDVCGYYIENLLYNCSETTFMGGFDNTFIKILNHVHKDYVDGVLGGYDCANEQDRLFIGTGWDIELAEKFILQCYEYYIA